MSSDTDRAPDPTQPYATPDPTDRGSVLPPPPARPWIGAAATPGPESLRPIGRGGVDWPTAPPSSGPVSTRTDEIPAWVPPVTSASPFGSEAPPPRPEWAPPSTPTPPPPTPPSPRSSYGAPPSPGAPRRGVYAGVLAIVALLAGLLGAIIGVNAADDDPPPAAAPTSVDRPTSGPVSTLPPPVSGDVAEPAAAVAQAVGPAVVLIQTTVGEGSGIVYDASGLIVTNAHVVENFDTVDVTLADGEIYEDAEVVGADPIRDIAVVRIAPSSDLTVAVFGPTDEVHVGEIAIAIGSPFGLEQTVTSGIVSAVGRVLSATNPVEMIQTDAPINPGNSGGALADAQGRVIGMNTAIRTADGTGGSVGVGFAIPSDTLIDIAGRIVDGESLEVAYLGVRGSAPTGSSNGVVILDVRPNSPAEAAGLQDGDEVRAIDGEAVGNMSSLSATIQLHRPGDTVTLTIERDDQQLDVVVTLAAAGG